MGNRKKMDQKDIEVWLAATGGFMGIFTAFMTVVLDIQTINLLRGLLVIGLLLFVGIAIWLSYRAKTNIPKLQFVTLIGVYIVSAGFFLWIGTWFALQGGAKSSSLVKYYDFESVIDLENWGTGTVISNERSFSGEKSLKVSLPISAEQETTFYLHWQHEFFADVVVGQVYWPIQDDINLEWAQICLPFDEWICTFISNKKGWNTFVLDLSNFEALESQRALNDFKLPGIVLQGVLKSTNPNLKTTPVFVDSIQLFVNGQE